MKAIIELKDLEFSFPGHSAPLFKNLDFQINEGESVAIVGTNGTGKSTLMKIIATLVKPAKGQYFFKGENSQQSIYALRNYINYAVGGTLGFYPRLTAAENLIFFSGLKGQMISLKEAEDILLKVGLKATDLDKKCFKFSLGMKQRMHIAKLFLEPSQVLLIDEPTNGLDTEGQELLIKLLNTELKSKTKIVISHDSHFLSAVTNITMRIKDGKLVKEN